MPFRIVQDYTAQYSDPIRVCRGQRVRLQRQDDEYAGWRWCVGPDGREGWVPEPLLQVSGQEATVLRDYDATELSARTGEEVLLLEELNAWVKVTNTSGQTGWLPARCLARGDTPGSP